MGGKRFRFLPGAAVNTRKGARLGYCIGRSLSYFLLLFLVMRMWWSASGSWSRYHGLNAGWIPAHWYIVPLSTQNALGSTGSGPPNAVRSYRHSPVARSLFYFSFVLFGRLVKVL